MTNGTVRRVGINGRWYNLLILRAAARQPGARYTQIPSGAGYTTRFRARRTCDLAAIYRGARLRSESSTKQRPAFVVDRRTCIRKLGLGLTA
jgi:hypothetical protein